MLKKLEGPCCLNIAKILRKNFFQYYGVLLKLFTELNASGNPSLMQFFVFTVKLKLKLSTALKGICLLTL